MRWKAVAVMKIIPLAPFLVLERNNQFLVFGNAYIISYIILPKFYGKVDGHILFTFPSHLKHVQRTFFIHEKTPQNR